MAGSGHGLVLAALLIGGCSAPERPALRFAHNLWQGYFPITLAREGVAVELIHVDL